MGFCGQVQDGIRLELGERLRHLGLVADIGTEEPVARVARHAGQGFQIAGIGQLVQVEDLVFAVVQQVADQCRADEAGAAGDQNAHE
ncbi:hypothetical protein D3C84_1069860 [compost metagenome]